MILGVIPARGGSKGLPGKNLRPLAGAPLIAHTIRAARASRLLTEFFVSTDDPAIAEAARAEGTSVPFLRPAKLAGDEVSIWDVVRHAVGWWEGQHGERADMVVLLQPTSPLRTSQDIDDCIGEFEKLDADVCLTVSVAHDSPYYNMVEVTAESRPFARPCSSRVTETLRRQDQPLVHALNGAVFVVRRTTLDDLKNQLLVKRLGISVMPRSRSVDVDTEEDLEIAEWYLQRRYLRGSK